ncbi:tol-pal system protein YbgF [Dokdonella soli]|uniref:Cell division coordinator CpoB n=1 Tax=Dokdonella soli TaxID=529810 RepID=A0ABP3TNK5_9GAMM
MKRSIPNAIAAVALVATAVAFAMPANAQRLSLAERVDRLEQQASPQNGHGNAVDLVNQISALQSQVQSLQGQVEELKHALDEAKQRNKDQYIDLDSRIGRLEGGGATAPRAASPAGASVPRADTRPPDVDLGSPANNPPPAPARNGKVGDLTDADRAAAPGDVAGANPPTAPGDPGTENTAYNDAFAALKDGRYAESARRFQTFIDQYPSGELTGNAYYWLGESYYVTQNYKIAQQSFETLLQRYPNSQKAPDALLKIGYSQYEQKQWDQAEATLNKVVQTYPDTTVARLAQGRLRALKMEARH